MKEDHSLRKTDLRCSDAATKSILFPEIRKCVAEVGNDRPEFSRAESLDW
jgi:hypothetical protein